VHCEDRARRGDHADAPHAIADCIAPPPSQQHTAFEEARSLANVRSRSEPARLADLVVVLGPTAVGKTHLGIELGLHFDGEVVNADSRYLYRGFSVGVAKPTLEERHGVPHHLIDILEPSDEMSLAIFQDRANSAIRSIHERGRLPLFIGGTPLYVNCVVEGWKIPAVPPDPEFRRRLESQVEREGVQPIWNRLRAIDPAAAERTGPNPRRIIRALEIYEKTGVPMSEQESRGPRPYRTLELGLWMPRDRLYSAIDRRVDHQIESGLVEEVSGLLDAGVDPSSPAFSSLGYRQLVPYLRGEQSLDEAIERIKFDTHRYVRHQETWLKRNERLIRIDVTEPGWVERSATLVSRFLAGEDIHAVST
jgi:tRNA dimethylallyltransferase